MFPPRRIVCLTDETVETLYLLGEQDRIVSISGYCVRPPEARLGFGASGSLYVIRLVSAQSVKEFYSRPPPPPLTH